MKLLYLSHGHPLLEYDDCSIFKKLGIDYFSTGYYAESSKPNNLPEIINPFQDKYNELFFRTCERDTCRYDRIGTHAYAKNLQFTNSIIKNEINFSNEFLELFDCIIISHNIRNILINDGKLNNIKVFVKTFCMHTLDLEHVLQIAREQIKAKIIRACPTYKNRGEIDADYVIRQSIDINDREWIGDKKSVCTFSSFIDLNDAMMIRRKMYYDEIVKLNQDIDFNIFGAVNGRYGTFITDVEKLDVLSSYRINLALGTPNATTTYSIMEAMAAGQPVICFGRNMYQSALFDTDMFIKHGENGFFINSPQEFRDIAIELLNNDELARQIGSNAKRDIEAYIGKDVISKQWKKMFEKEGLL